MVSGVREVAGDVVMQRPSMVERQKLSAVADPQDRTVLFERGFEDGAVKAQLGLGVGVSETDSG